MSSVSVRSTGIFLVLAGIVGTTSPALEKIGLGCLLVGVVLLAANHVARRRQKP